MAMTAAAAAALAEGAKLAGTAAAGAGAAGGAGAGLGAGLGALAPEFAGALGSGATGSLMGGAGLAGMAPELGGALGSAGAFVPESTAMAAMPQGASMGNPGMMQGLMNNIFPSGKSGLENALLAGQMGSMLGGLFGNGSKGQQMGPSPLIGHVNSGGGYKPTASAQLEALQQLGSALNQKKGGFFG